VNNWTNSWSSPIKLWISTSLPGMPLSSPVEDWIYCKTRLPISL
jgi:hypothetical protein